MMAESDFRLRYPLRAVAPNYFSALLGLVFTVTPLTLVTPLAVVSGVLAFCALIFFLFGLHTAIRHNTFVTVSDRGVTLVGLWGADISWCELRELKLNCFSTRRARREGWMQLRLRGGKRTICLDSTLEGFDRLVARAAMEARRNKLQMLRDTEKNLIALGLAELSENAPQDANGSTP